MSNYQPRIAVIDPVKTEPFKVMIRELSAKFGSERKATEAIGASRNTIQKLMYESYLTDKQARIILAKYKELK